jgi:hypothetical protein
MLKVAIKHAMSIVKMRFFIVKNLDAEVPRLVLLLVIDSIGVLGVIGGWRLACGILYDTAREDCTSATDACDNTKKGIDNMCNRTPLKVPPKNAIDRIQPSIKRKTLRLEQSSSSAFNNLAALSNELRDFLVLMRQQAQGVSDVVPLPLTLSPRQPRSQLARELFGVLVLCISLALVGVRGY